MTTVNKHRIATIAWTSMLISASTWLPSATGDTATILEKPLANAELGWSSTWPNFQQSTDDVQLVTGATVDRIEWFGFFFDDNNTTDSFKIRFFTGVSEDIVTTHFYEDDVVASFTDTGLDSIVGTNVVRYSADISEVALSAGTRYELSILAFPNVQPNPIDWVWSHSNPEPGDPQFARLGDRDRWYFDEFTPDSRRSHAFTLSASAVPEPSSLGLLAVAAIGMVTVRRGRRRPTDR